MPHQSPVPSDATLRRAVGKPADPATFSKLEVDVAVLMARLKDTTAATLLEEIASAEAAAVA